MAAKHARNDEPGRRLPESRSRRANVRFLNRGIVSSSPRR